MIKEYRITNSGLFPFNHESKIFGILFVLTKNGEQFPGVNTSLGDLLLYTDQWLLMYFILHHIVIICTFAGIQQVIMANQMAKCPVKHINLDIFNNIKIS